MRDNPVDQVGETIFDKKFMENISEYSRSQKFKKVIKSIGPDKWESNQRSNSTENDESRSVGKTSPKDLQHMLNI